MPRSPLKRRHSPPARGDSPHSRGLLFVFSGILASDRTAARGYSIVVTVPPDPSPSSVKKTAGRATYIQSLSQPAPVPSLLFGKFVPTYRVVQRAARLGNPEIPPFGIWQLTFVWQPSRFSTKSQKSRLTQEEYAGIPPWLGNNDLTTEGEQDCVYWP